MSSRKRPLVELSQAQATPSRYAPSTPHAIRATQQRSGTKPRSARSVRHVDASSVRPDSARGVLRRLAKITAPFTRRILATPANTNAEKENIAPDNDADDDRDIQKPHLTFSIEESLEEEDSELPAAPTPSVLPESDDYDDATETFQNLQQLRENQRTGRRASLRKSHASLLLHSEPPAPPADEDSDDNEGNTTMMTERGRRAISEEMTGRLSRYSFGSIRMSEFGSELEIRRDSDRQQKLAALEAEDDYNQILGDEPLDLDGETEDLRNLRHTESPMFVEDESAQLPGIGNDTFQLDGPDETEEISSRKVQQRIAASHGNVETVFRESFPLDARHEQSGLDPTSNRRQTLIEAVTATARPGKRKRVKLTRNGNVVPSLPKNLIKRIAQESQIKAGRRKPVLGRDHMKALEQATEWFFEQVGEDLAAYSSHGRRKKRVDVDDVLLLMRRQQAFSQQHNLSSFAKEWLPREVRESVDIPERA